MPANVKNLTVGKPWKLIVSFALPLMLSQLFQQLYNTADSLIVGHNLGTDALAATTSAGNMVQLLVSFFTGLSMGAGVIISRYFGAEDYDNVSKAIHTNITFGLICGTLLSIAGVLLTPVFLVIMKVDPDILELAESYYTVYFAGSLAVVMYNLCLGAMNALGDSKRPLIYLIVSSLLNIVLDTVFVRFLHLNVWSASLATVISQFFSVVLCLMHLCKKGEIYTVSFKKLRIDGHILKDMIRYGLPSGLANCVINIANVIVQSCVNSFDKIATAAFGIHAKVEGFGFVPITSFTMAISTFVSQNLGARKYERAKKGALFGIVTTMLLAEFIGAVIFIFCKPIISFFDGNPDVVELGTRLERIVALFYCLLAFSHAVAAVCRGAGKAFVPMFVMLSVWCVFRIIYIIIVMSMGKGIEYVLWAYPITWTISSIIYTIYYFKSDWVHGFDK